MPNVSIKELQENIKTVIETDMPEIKSVELIMPENIDVSNSVGYPKIIIFWDSNNTATLNEQGNTVPLTIICCSVAESVDDEDAISFEIQSDCFQYISKLMDLLQREHYFNGDLNESATPFNHRYNDGLAGVTITPNFIIQKPAYNV